MGNFQKFKNINKQLRSNKTYALVMLFAYALITALLLVQGLKVKELLILFIIFLFITIYLFYSYFTTLKSKYSLTTVDEKEANLINSEINRSKSRSRRMVFGNKNIYLMQSYLAIIYMIPIKDIKEYKISNGKRNVYLYVNDDVVKVSLRSFVTNDFIFTDNIEKDINKYLTTKIKDIKEHEGK